MQATTCKQRNPTIRLVCATFSLSFRHKFPLWWNHPTPSWSTNQPIGDKKSPWVFDMLQYLKRFCLPSKAFHLLDKMRYILWMMALQEACDIIIYDRHLGHHLAFNPELEITKSSSCSSSSSSSSSSSLLSIHGKNVREIYNILEKLTYYSINSNITYKGECWNK